MKNLILEKFGDPFEQVAFKRFPEKLQRYQEFWFPGCKRQINPKAVKEVLKAANLTADDGVDSQVFYRGLEPLSALIDEFRVPLRKLKDK